MRTASRPAVFCHSSHGDWGRGIVLESNPTKLHLAFENGGRRTFVNDPRFLRLLLRVELPVPEYEALVAKLTGGAKPARGGTPKRRARKASPAPA